MSYDVLDTLPAVPDGSKTVICVAELLGEHDYFGSGDNFGNCEWAFVVDVSVLRSLVTVMCVSVCVEVVHVDVHVDVCVEAGERRAC